MDKNTDAEPNTKLLSGWAPTPIVDRFAALAEQNERTISGELRLAVREHLTRNERQQDAA